MVVTGGWSSHDPWLDHLSALEAKPLGLGGVRRRFERGQKLSMAAEREISAMVCSSSNIDDMIYVFGWWFGFFLFTHIYIYME